MEETILTNYKHQIEQENMPAGKKKTILAAITLFANNGFDGTSTAQLSETAGVSQATIFKYFKTKQDILFAIIQPLLRLFKEDFWQQVYERTDLEEVVHFVVTNRLDCYQHNRQLFKILVQEYLVNADFQVLVRENIGTSQLDFTAYLDRLKKANPDMNPALSLGEFMSIFLGHLSSYMIAQALLGQAGDVRRVESAILVALRQSI